MHMNRITQWDESLSKSVLLFLALDIFHFIISLNGFLKIPRENAGT
jgi:hypothetical protein